MRSLAEEAGQARNVEAGELHAINPPSPFSTLIYIRILTNDDSDPGLGLPSQLPVTKDCLRLWFFVTAAK